MATLKTETVYSKIEDKNIKEDVINSKKLKRKIKDIKELDVCKLCYYDGSCSTKVKKICDKELKPTEYYI